MGQVIISKQAESSENYKKFKEIVNEKNIKVLVVGANCENSNNTSIEKVNKILYPQKIQIEEDLYFDILWPNNDNLITENALNNNSIVCKLNYKEFSMLFTGDIEEIAEKQILQKYSNSYSTNDSFNKNNKNSSRYNVVNSQYNSFKSILNSTVLKVGHHGSKTSTTIEFLEAVKPQIALIGVGENNKFGHPNEGVIKLLENFKCKIYRTDKMGEITIKVDNRQKVKIEKYIE
ncbi:MAG: hypothetical protein IJH76_02665 [Clostridia bacterium]|nr:hypothetical protein [Clostridia bacterium]